MNTNLSSILDFTLQHEGGYSSNRSDAGNWTGGRVGSGRLAGSKYGLSAPLVARDRGVCVTAQKMKLMTEDDFRALAVKYFWQPMQCDKLPAGVDALVFDHGFNTGSPNSVCVLQRILDVKQDGILGPATLAALETASLMDIGKYASHSQIAGLQERLGITQTGSLDRLTLALIEKRERRLELICLAISSLQLTDYRSKKGFPIFGDGWLRRARERLSVALELVAAVPKEAPALA